MLLEALVKVFLPYQVEDEVALASLVGVEADVVLNTNLVEHVKDGHLGGERKWAVNLALVGVAEVAILRVARGILNHELVWHFMLVPYSFTENIFPIFFVESREQSCELVFK